MLFGCRIDIGHFPGGSNLDHRVRIQTGIGGQAVDFLLGLLPFHAMLDVQQQIFHLVRLEQIGEGTSTSGLDGSIHGGVAGQDDGLCQWRQLLDPIHDIKTGHVRQVEIHQAYTEFFLLRHCDGLGTTAHCSGFKTFYSQDVGQSFPEIRIVIDDKHLCLFIHGSSQEIYIFH